jgi:hypothetical protein
MRKDIKLVAGQNLRYVGKGFPGYIKGQPYMVFVAYHSVHEVLVKYNDADVIVNKYHTAPL